MKPRPHISVSTKVNVAIAQAGGWVECPLCSLALYEASPRVLEHLVPHELGGSSEAENLRWVHQSCAATKTAGSKATCADGDIHKIAKAKRLANPRKSKNPMRKHATLKRTVGGAVVAR